MSGQGGVALEVIPGLRPLLALDGQVHRAAQFIEVVADAVGLPVDVQQRWGAVAGQFILEQLALLLVGAVLDGLVQAQAGVLVGGKHRWGHEQQQENS